MIRKMRSAGVVALVTGVGIFAAACGGNNVAEPGVVAPVEPGVVTPGEVVEGGEEVVEGTSACVPGSTLVFDSFVQWNPEVITNFEASRGITIQHNHFAQSTDLQDALLAGLAVGGAGVGDVVTIEGDVFNNAMQHPDDWVTLPEVPGRWLSWAEDEGRLPDGTLKGYRTDIGPLAVLYNARLLEENGFGQYADPEAFGEWIGGANATWQTYLDAGREWHNATGIAWIDDVSNGAARAALRQLPAAFEDPATGQPIDMATNTAVHDIFIQMGQAMADGLGNNTAFWNDGWGPAMLHGEFATMVAPPWQIGWPLMQSGWVDGNFASPEAEGWRIATAFPNGGGNWGGTFVSVPSHGTQIECAIEFANYLTSDEIAAGQWATQSAFPSQAALIEAGITGDPNVETFLGGQDYSTVLGHLAEAIPNAPFRGEQFGNIQDNMIFSPLGTVGDGINTPEQAWEQAVSLWNDEFGH